MTVTSFSFLTMLFFGVLLYYAVPKKYQWVTLLILSLVFYSFAATPYTFLYIIIQTLIAYISTNIIKKNFGSRRAYYSAVIAVLLNLIIWFGIKGTSLWKIGILCVNRILPFANITIDYEFVAALGMGYYTAQVIGYILDCYWGITQPQNNPLKLLLFVCFFPQLTVGPISKYNQVQSLYEYHNISYTNISFGCQRILWGMFKKIVLADRITIITSGIWGDTGTYTGVWPWIATFMYPLQIYCDFSGCVDIVLGAAELFDIHLPENFRNPFKARSAQEFWQRWHITLGAWAKDYVYYPILKSRFLISVGKKTKKCFSKKIAKFIPWAIGMGLLWLAMGIWHGSLRHIVGVSFWYWIILVVAELFHPVTKRIIDFFKIDTESYSYILFQRIRTYLIFSIGCIFFAASGTHEAVYRFKVLINSLSCWNPWTLFDSTILNLGITWTDVNLLIFGILCLVKVDDLRENVNSVRAWIKQQLIVFRWALWIALFIIVLIYGMYGPGYSASQFIYQGF